MANYNQPAPKSKLNLQTTAHAQPALVKTPMAQIPNSFGFCLLKQAVNVAVDFYLTRRRARIVKNEDGSVKVNNKQTKFIKPKIEGAKVDFVKGYLTLESESRQNFAKVELYLGDFVAIQGHTNTNGERIKAFDKKALAHIEAAQIFIFTKLYENLPAILAGKTTQIVLKHQDFCKALGIGIKRSTPALLLFAKAFANTELELTTQARKKSAEPKSAKGKMFASVEQGAGKKRGEITLTISPQNAKVLQLLLQYKITAPEVIYDLKPRQQRLFLALAREARRNARREQKGELLKLGVKDLLQELGAAKALNQWHAARSIVGLTADLAILLDKLPAFNLVFFETTTTKTNADGVETEIPIPPKRIVEKGEVLFATAAASSRDFGEVCKIVADHPPPPEVIEPTPPAVEEAALHPKGFFISIESIFERLFGARGAVCC